MNNFYVEWNDIDKFVASLELKTKYNYLIAIHRGGLVLGTILSNKFDIPLIVIYSNPNSDEVDAKFFSNKSFLIVDDISDSGKTLKTVYDFFKKQENQTIDTLCYCMKKTTTFIPTYYNIETSIDKWIVFPWEYQNVK